MTPRKTSLLLATTSAAALAVFAFGGMGSTSAFAQCAGPVPLPGGGVLGTAGPDVLTCTFTVTAAPGDEVLGVGGDDTITVTASSVGLIDGGTGDDTILVTNFFLLPSLTPEVRGGVGDDTITINNSAVIGAGVFGDTGNDTVNVTGLGSVTAISGGFGDDTINFDGLLFGTIAGDSGEDLINLTSGGGGAVNGGADNDLINLDGAIVGGITGSSGEDVINLKSGGAGVVGGGSGNDTITQTGGVVLGISGDSGEDTIDLKGGFAGFVGGGSDDDLIMLNGADLGGVLISGESGNDTIELNTGTAGIVEGGSDEDTITLTDAVVVAIVGDVFADGVDGPGANDTINLNGGTVAEFKGLGGDVWGQGGEDRITLNGAFVENDIRGGNQNDTIDLLSGTAGGVVQGDANEDTITLAGAVVFGITGDSLADGVDGPGNNDLIVLNGGTVGLDVWGQGGDDTISQNGALILGNIRGGNNNDRIDLLAGTAGIVQGDADEDAIILTGGSVFAITGDSFADGIDGAGDNDLIELFGGTVGLDVWGQGGEDVIILDGALVTRDVQAGNDNDIVSLIDGTVGGDAFGGAGDDQGIVTGNFDFDNLGAGAGSFLGDSGAGDVGDDTLTFLAWTGAVNADRLPEWNTVNLTLFTQATFTGGTLETDGPSDIEVFIDDTSTMLLDDSGLGGGDLTIVGNLTNEGLIDMSSADGDPDNVLTITGDYTASSDLFIDTFLNNGVVDITDLVVIGGDTSGNTDVFVTNAGGPGGLTGRGPTDGILVVDVGGVSAGTFSLTNDLVADIYEYDLLRADGQNWYLQSDFLDQIYVYESLASGMQTIGSALVGQLVERVGVRSAVPSTITDASGNPVAGGGPVDSGLWIRGVGAWLDSSGSLDSTTGASFDQTIGFVQAGGEFVVSQSASGRFLIGALGHWGTSSMDVDGSFGGQRGSADYDFWGGGLTATWYGASGLYLDGVIQYTSYDIDISTTTRFANTSTDGSNLAVSGEAGYRIPVSATATIVPQAQLVWQSIDIDDFTDPDGVRVSLQDGDSLIGRLGLAAENSWALGGGLFTGYAEANLLYEFLGDNSVNVATGVGTTAISQDLSGGAVEFGLGGTMAFNDNLSLYAEVDYTVPFDNGVEGFQALAGLRYTFASPPPPPPAPVIAPLAETAFIVFFDWDRADLTAESNLILDDVVVAANQSGYASIRLDGYTDLSGSPAYNLGLSERRANSVADGLIARGIAPDEIVIRAFGEENPLVPTPDGVREPQNRRVEIFLS